MVDVSGRREVADYFFDLEKMDSAKNLRLEHICRNLQLEIVYSFVNPAEIVVCPRLWPVGMMISPF